MCSFHMLFGLMCAYCSDVDIGSGVHDSIIHVKVFVCAFNLLEDQSQVESGPLSSMNSGPYGTFIGVYDGHGGPETSRFVNENLFANLKKMSANVIKKVFLATEDEFLSVVREQWRICPQIASVGTCCLGGVICNGLIYVANAGDSRVVLGRADRECRR
ncbi:putative protein-serine/threonine phosphatase [Helianthus anomalus]